MKSSSFYSLSLSILYELRNLKIYKTLRHFLLYFIFFYSSKREFNFLKPHLSTAILKSKKTSFVNILKRNLHMFFFFILKPLLVNAILKNKKTSFVNI